jgi:uncharacterized phiE125 gp8 family phage protein
MQRILLEGPAVEPVLVAEAKAHLRLDGGAEDDLVGALIAAARVAVEIEIRRVLIAQSWRVLIADWPAGGLVLPIQPVIAVGAVRAVDAEGQAEELFEDDDWRSGAVDGALHLIRRVTGAEHYEVDFTAGYGSSGVDVPQPLRQAVRILVTHWYENRSAAMLGDAARSAPFGYRELLTPYRRMALC